MRSFMVLVVVGLFALGCKKGDDAAAKKEDNKTDCQKAADNLLSIVKADTSEMGKMMAKQMADEKPEELAKECDKEEKKHPGSAKCMVAAKSIEDIMKCSEKSHGGGGEDKPPADEPKVEDKGEEGK